MSDFSSESEDSDYSSTLSDSEPEEYTNQEQIRKKRNKNQPLEISSKIPVSRHRRVIDTPSFQSRDPRFDHMSHKSESHTAKFQYAFISDLKQKEMKMLQEQLKNEKNPIRKQKLHQALDRMKSKMVQQEQKRKEQEFKKEWRKKEIERIEDGKRPFYLKRSEIKKQMLVEKYQSLAKNPKKLEKAMEKQRKKNKSKDLRKMPYQ